MWSEWQDHPEEVLGVERESLEEHIADWPLRKVWGETEEAGVEKLVSGWDMSLAHELRWQ